MIQICRKDRNRVLNAIRSGHIDAADMSFPNLIDSIVLTMKRHGFVDPPADFLEDQRRDNSHIPFDSLTDVPFAQVKLINCRKVITCSS